MSAAALRLTMTAIAAAMDGRLRCGDANRVADGFSIDSRSIRPGDLFFAIVAARDGHAFLPDALARGATGAVVSSWSEELRESTNDGPAIIQVRDTTRALQDLARHVRRHAGGTVLAITGSVGKTTTKEAIASVLQGRFRVVRNRGNLNNHLGLPLSLLELRHGDADIAVMELGMNHAGEIRVLVDIAEPQIRVWTNVGEAHLGHFESVDAIADAKAEILEQATARDVLVCNADDPRVMRRAANFAGRVTTFGEAEKSTVRAVNIEDLGVAGSRARLVTPTGERPLRVKLVGRGSLSNALCAAAVGDLMGVPLDEIVERIAALEPPPHRGTVLRLAGGRISVVDDSYNSSPPALRQALDAIGRDRLATRKAAVLGEMLELGERSRELHEACGRKAATTGLHRLITVGGEPARALGEAAIRDGMPPGAVTHAASSAEAGGLIVSWLEPGDLVLVKGSRGIRTDVVVDRIRAELA